jgi:hypothetical protein
MEERWAHIVDNKRYMRAYYAKVLATIENPNWVVRGYAGRIGSDFIVGQTTVPKRRIPRSQST